MTNFFATKFGVYLVAACALAISGCAEKTSSISSDGNGNALVKMSPPRIITPRAVVVDNLRLLVTINDGENTVEVDMDRVGDEWTGQANVPRGSDVNLVVEWSEVIGQRTLPLAQATKSLESVNANFDVTVENSGYNTQGPEFDADGDQISNLAERQQDTDPFDPNDPVNTDDEPAQVVVPASLRTHVVDGIYENNFWRLSQMVGVDGQDLLINNLIVDNNALTPDGQTNYQWGAIHNGRQLSIFVFGKRNLETQQNLHGDSGTFFFQDDTLEIFLDGDLSALDDYDEVDDLHILIPLLRGPSTAYLPNKSGEVNSRIKLGANVQDVIKESFDSSMVEFAVCVCPGERVTWEIRIDMAAAGIPTGKTFGFELQIDEDDDGGTRDAKWAWAADSRGPNDTETQSDETWRFPSRMGKIKLLPFPSQQ